LSTKSHQIKPASQCRRYSAQCLWALVTFLSNGRMIVAIADGRPGQIEGRAYCSYCGDYSFDGTRLVTTVDDGSSEFWRRSPQIRAARFSEERMVLRPPNGLLGPDDVVRELTWERIAPSP
jgi:hypothetical protein